MKRGLTFIGKCEVFGQMSAFVVSPEEEKGAWVMDFVCVEVK